MLKHLFYNIILTLIERKNMLPHKMGIYPINNSRKSRLNIISMIFTSRSELGTVFKGGSCYDCHDVDTVAVTVKRLHRFRKQYGVALKRAFIKTFEFSFEKK